MPRAPCDVCFRSFPGTGRRPLSFPWGFKGFIGFRGFRVQGFSAGLYKGFCHFKGFCSGFVGLCKGFRALGFRVLPHQAHSFFFFCRAFLDFAKGFREFSGFFFGGVGGLGSLPSWSPATCVAYDKQGPLLKASFTYELQKNPRSIIYYSIHVLQTDPENEGISESPGSASPKIMP